MKKFVLFALLGSITTISFAGGSLTGKVYKMRIHQYLNNSGWDKQTWFCLDTMETISGCPTNATCGGRTGFAISKDASERVFSMVLAAQMSGTPITVEGDDNIKVENDYCAAKSVDINTP